MMSVEVRINRDVIGTIEILNVTANGPDPELPIHTYDWTYSGQGFAGERVHKLDGRIEHRYRDGAIVLAHNVLAAVASRYQVAAHLDHASVVAGCPLCDDVVVDAEIYCGAVARLGGRGRGCGLVDGHDGQHATDEGEEWS